MEILIKKEVLEEYGIDTTQLLLSADNFEVFQFIDILEVEILYKVKWKIENNTIIIYKEQEKNK